MPEKFRKIIESLEFYNDGVISSFGKNKKRIEFTSDKKIDWIQQIKPNREHPIHILEIKNFRLYN